METLQIEVSPSGDTIEDFEAEQESTDESSIAETQQTSTTDTSEHNEHNTSVDLYGYNGEDNSSTVELETDFNQQQSYVIGSAEKYVVRSRNQKNSTGKKTKTCCAISCTIFWITFVTMSILLGYYVKPADDNNKSSERDRNTPMPTPVPESGEVTTSDDAPSTGNDGSDSVSSTSYQTEINGIVTTARNR